jgi:hypothetical protein
MHEPSTSAVSPYHLTLHAARRRPPRFTLTAAPRPGGVPPVVPACPRSEAAAGRLAELDLTFVSGWRPQGSSIDAANGGGWVIAAHALLQLRADAATGGAVGLRVMALVLSDADGGPGAAAQVYTPARSKTAFILAMACMRAAYTTQIIWWAVGGREGAPRAGRRGGGSGGGSGGGGGGGGGLHVGPCRRAPASQPGALGSPLPPSAGARRAPHALLHPAGPRFLPPFPLTTPHAHTRSPLPPAPPPTRPHPTPTPQGRATCTTTT